MHAARKWLSRRVRHMQIEASFWPESELFETAFLFFTSEMKWSTTWVGLQWKWKLPSYFFFCVPVLSCSRTTLRLRFYSHLHTHLCLSAPQTETTKRWWRSVFFLSSTTKHSSQVYFTRRPHIANRATTTHESQRCPAWLVPPLCRAELLFYIQKLLLRISNGDSIVCYGIITLINKKKRK